MTKLENRLGLVRHMTSFYDSYPTPEVRLKNARAMAKGEAGATGFRGRDTMAGHWGDTAEQYQTLAQCIDDIRYGANDVMGEAALIFRQGRPEAVYVDPENGDHIIDGPLTIDCGYIAKDYNLGSGWVASVVHARGGDKQEDRQRAERRGRTYLPHLALGVGVLLVQPRILTADLWTATISEAAPEPKESYAYTAIVPTDGDAETYQATRRTLLRPYLFGTSKVKEFLDAVKTVIEAHDTAELRKSSETVARFDSFLAGRTPLAAISAVPQKTA